MFVPTDRPKASAADLPTNCTFRKTDWNILARFWHPVAFSSEVRDKPVAAKLLDVNLVACRMSTGIHVFKDQCPHRGTALSLGWMKSDQLVCGFHGLHYDADGRCTKIASTKKQVKPPKALCLTKYLSTERYGMIWVLLRPEALAPLPEWPELEGERSAWTTVQLPRGTWRASAARHAENFFDPTHISWLHMDTFGNQAKPEIPPFEIEYVDHGMRFEFPYPQVLYNDAANETMVTYGLSVTYPFSCTQTTIDGRGVEQYILHDVACPLSASESEIFQVTSVGPDLDPKEYESFQLAVNAEDIPIVESQKPGELPLSPLWEVHLPGDQVSVQYRMALAKFGLGTPSLDD